MTENLIPVAIAYDFDGTLSPATCRNMTLSLSGMFPPGISRQKPVRLAETNHMYTILANMWLMIQAALFTPADYRPGKGIDLAVRAILDRIEATSRIR